jgi:hypothetical protein
VAASWIWGAHEPPGILAGSQRGLFAVVSGEVLQASQARFVVCHHFAAVEFPDEIELLSKKRCSFRNSDEQADCRHDPDRKAFDHAGATFFVAARYWESLDKSIISD